MQTKSYVFDPRPAFPLLITARQYSSDDCAQDDPDALTLVFAHATGFHKEHWEPTLDHLFALVRQSANATVKIRDAWSIDAPNHGEAAVLNENELLWGYVPVFPWEEYARAVHLFLAGLGTGVDVDFSKRNLVGVGHSMGASAIVLSQTYQPPLPYVGTLLVEPMLLPPAVDSPATGGPRNVLLEGAEKRRDVWQSREAARAHFAGRLPWKTWDPRVLDAFVNVGLRALPTAAYPDASEGVTLTCTKAQEAACYRDKLGRTKAYRYLPHLCAAMPVHFIWGALADNPILTEEVKQGVMSDGTRGKHRSDQRVAGAGHMLPQMQPEGLASALWSALTANSRSVGGERPERSRL
ncbi:hypothetical protein BV20DRAFT_958570 [Pilatotrama ljubarskyi]|nr:hypothetical protein BV20DRAFT_958570 [Pilatotrama ljubarskyi]